MLKKYMEKHGLTQAKVASDIGISEMQVWRILHGHPISAKIGMRLAEAYGLPLATLIKMNAATQSEKAKP